MTEGRSQPPIRPKGGALVLAHVLAKSIDTFNSQAELSKGEVLVALEYLRFVMTESLVRGAGGNRRISDGPYFKE